MWKSRDLIRTWTGRTIRGRYQQSVLGWLWAVVQPAATVAVFSFVFTIIVPVVTDPIPYIVFSYTAMVPWTFFASSIGDMTDSLTQNMSLVTKIYFPREILPLSAMFARLMDFGVASVLLIILMIYYQVQPFPLGWLILPAIIATQIMLIIGLGLLASALNVFTRDVSPLIRLSLQVWFYATPIIYPVTLVPEWLRPIYYLNPMAGIIMSYRDVLILRQLPGNYLLIAALISFVIFLIGYWFFKRVEFQFADIV
jgi:lipopolysaccharide transport system permease protein